MTAGDWLRFGGVMLLCSPLLAWGEDPLRAHDIYLVGDRICHKCTIESAGPETVTLKNRKGEAGVYPLKEIIGIDTHPFARRYVLHLTHEVGLPARIIVPQAFEDERYLHY